MRQAILMMGVLIWSCGSAVGESRFDVGLLLGSTRATDEGQVLEFDRGTTYQATFAWDVWRGSRAKLSLEVPFIASPAFTVVTPGVRASARMALRRS